MEHRCGEMQEMKAPVRGTPGVLHKCNIKRYNGGLRPCQGGKGVDTLVDTLLGNIPNFSKME